MLCDAFCSHTALPRAKGAHQPRDSAVFFSKQTAKRLLVTTIFRENLSVVDGPSKLCICLEDDLFIATPGPAWPTPMRALISKLNLPHAPERLTDHGQRTVQQVGSKSCRLHPDELNRCRCSELLRQGPVRIRHRAPPRKRSGTVVPMR